MLTKEWSLRSRILAFAAFQLIMCWFSFSWCKSPPDFLASIKELNSSSVLFMSLEKNVLNNQMGEKNGIKARSLNLLSFLPFNVQSNWYFKSISLLWVLESKRQCFRGGSILFYLELLFLCRKLLFCFPPTPRELGCVPIDLCLVFYNFLTLLTNSLHFYFRIIWEITLVGCDVENAPCFKFLVQMVSSHKPSSSFDQTYPLEVTEGHQDLYNSFCDT